MATPNDNTKKIVERHIGDQHSGVGESASEAKKEESGCQPFIGIVEEQPNPDRIYPPPSKRFLIITALCLGTLLDAIDITIIGVAVPTISTEFNALDDPVFGVIYKFFDPKKVYLCSILVFEVGSIISASAPSSPVFIFGRAITGCGGAGLLQGALCIVALCVAIEKRPLYLSIVVSSFGAAACFGPVMGGALTDRASWRWCFWINVPVGVVVAIIIVFSLHLEGISNVQRRLPLMQKLRHLDPIGVCLLIASVCCLVLALQWGGFTEPWRSAKVIGLLTGSGLIGITFFIYEWRIGDKAMLPWRVFGQRSVLMGCLYGCFLQMINDTDTYYIPFYFQATQGASAISSGAKFISLVIPEIVAIVITGAIVSKIGHYVPFMIGGACIAALGTGLLTRITLGTPTVEWAAYLVVSGLGIGLGLNLPYTALHVVLSEEDVPIGNGITVLCGQLGGAIGVSVGQSTFLNGLLREIPKLVTGLTAHDIVTAGATNLEKLTTDRETLRRLQIVYAKAVVSTLWLPVAGASAAAICACGMEWKKVTAKEKAKGPNEVEPRG
ncbi:MAG: hypothetical protein Q9208_004513 [Pyrenodesmia sp. 3 TL-2023]